jgi:hypothetical protein
MLLLDSILFPFIVPMATSYSVDHPGNEDNKYYYNDLGRPIHCGSSLNIMGFSTSALARLVKASEVKDTSLNRPLITFSPILFRACMRSELWIVGIPTVYMVEYVVLNYTAYTLISWAKVRTKLIMLVMAVHVDMDAMLNYRYSPIFHSLTLSGYCFTNGDGSGLATFHIC